MTLRGRLSLTLVAAAALLALPLLYATSRLAELRQIAVHFRESHTEAFQVLGALKASLTALDRYTRSYVAVPDPVFQQGMRHERRMVRDAWERLGAIGYREPAAPVGALLDSLDAATERIEALVGSGRVREATGFLNSVRPLLAAAGAAADRARDAVDRASEEDVTRAEAISHRAARGALAGGVVALALALAVGVWTTWRLTQPLGRLRDAMATVAAGDFVAPADLPHGQQDEIGDLARSFRSMTERLAELDHVKGEFVNAISHDLKAPLGMIATCAELVEEDGDGGALAPAQRELLATIREHVRVLAERVNKLLHLSRLEAGGFPIQPEPVPVRQVFDALRRAYGPEAERRGLVLTVVVDASLPTLMTVDTDCFYNEILGNLVSNALKFTPRGGRVEVRAWGATQDGDGTSDVLHVTVTDSGIGIPTADVPFVFLKYYQVGGRRRGDGAGLGLAIVRHAVEAHEGIVAVESTPGRGTSFHVTLPVAGPGRSRRGAEPAARQGKYWNAPRPAAV